MSTEPLPVIRGTLDALVLKTLAWGPMHGFEIATWLEERSGRGLYLEDAALYQSLRRLEERSLVAAEMAVTENNRRARYYSLTAAGRAQLKAETTRWRRYASMVNGILDLPLPKTSRG
jgi:PadR family transcriptional regulator PadR